MTNEPLVSILMAVYNTEISQVQRAIQSVLTQNYSCYELVVINDGSNELLSKQIKRYTELYPKNVRYVQHPNMGQSASINRGIEISNGSYITILDADDEYKPNHLALCVQQMATYDLIASTTTTIVNNETQYYVTDKHNPKKLIHVDDCILFATLFGKKEVFTTLKFENKYAADAYFYEKADEHYFVQKVNLRSYIYYRNNSDSITAQHKLQHDHPTA